MNTNVNTAAKTVRGKCRLCLRRRVLRESHFMPAAVYPKKRKPMFGMGDQTILNPEQIKAHLLCTECEQRFDRNGESHVLYWLAPKAKAGKSPLQRKLREVEPVFREEPPSGNLYFASMLGIDAEKFAYFGLSLLWRAAAHRWPFPNGKKSLLVDLGEYYKPLRRYLLGETSFPPHTYVMLTICTDTKSQKHWTPPQPGDFKGMFVVPVMGMAFRFWLGRVLPPTVDQLLLFPADGKIFSRDCWDVFGPMLEPLFKDPLPD